jgi:polyferredoxin
MSRTAGRGLFAANRDGSPWYTRTFRITTIRIIAQTFFFSLFMFLLWVTWFSRLGGYPVSLFLELDPLVGIATALSTGTVYRWLWRGMWVLVPTLILGRVFCNWMCP